MGTLPDQQVGMEYILDEEVATTSPSFPKVLPSTFFPEKPTLSGVSAAETFLPLLLDQESYLKDFATPTMTDERIEKAFAVDDGSDLRNMAIAKLGFSLLQPTEGGRIGPAIAQAGQTLTNDLMKIKQQQKKEQKAAQIGMINAKMKKDAQNILDRKSVFDMNRQLLTTIAGKEYDAKIAADKALMDLYKSQVQAATSKFQDYQLEGVKPKKVQVAMRDAEGGVGDALTAFVVQSINDNGSLSAPQYYKPSNEMGADGLPQMELIENPEGIVEISLAKTGTPEDFSSKSGVTKFQDVFSGLQTKDRAILTLDKLYNTSGRLMYDYTGDSPLEEQQISPTWGVTGELIPEAFFKTSDIEIKDKIRKDATSVTGYYQPDGKDHERKVLVKDEKGNIKEQIVFDYFPIIGMIPLGDLKNESDDLKLAQERNILLNLGYKNIPSEEKMNFIRKNLLERRDEIFRHEVGHHTEKMIERYCEKRLNLRTISSRS